MDISHSILWTEEAKRAYAAGIIDGEGCISIVNAQKSFRAYVEVGQSSRGWSIIRFLQDEFGASVSSAFRPSVPKALMRLALFGGVKAFRFLLKIEPYLIYKKQQADLAIRFHRLFCQSSHRHWTPAHVKSAKRYQSQMKWFNRKGPKADCFLLVEDTIKFEPMPLFDGVLDRSKQGRLDPLN